MNHPQSVLRLVVLACLSAVLILAGCGSNGPTSSGLPPGPGYRINLTASPEIIQSARGVGYKLSGA